MNLPHPDDLLERPHLAILFVLEATLSAAIRAMAGMHPEIYQGSFPRTTTELDHRADRLMDLCSEVRVALAKYQAAMEEGDRLSRTPNF
jgi:hypothetical protein